MPRFSIYRFVIGFYNRNIKKKTNQEMCMKVEFGSR